MNKDAFTMSIGEGMDVFIYKERDQMGKAAAGDVAEKLRELLEKQAEVNVVFAAAPSQNEFLKHLIQAKEIDWTKINAFHMDEYIGLEDSAPQRFGNYLNERIFSQLPFRRVHYINGNAGDIAGECSRYETLLREHPIDIVLMGIGENGHIAFNDPPVADFKDPYFVKKVELDLACRTQQVNDKCFDTLPEVPLYALTLTIPALLSGKYLFCMVPAKLKAQAVYRTLTGEIDSACPASILRTHPRVRMYLDADSSSLLNLKRNKEYV